MRVGSKGMRERINGGKLGQECIERPARGRACNSVNFELDGIIEAY